MPSYLFYRGKTEPAPSGMPLQIDTDVIIGKSQFSDFFEKITSLEEDMLTIAAAIFAADRGTLRGEREDFARTLELYVPVVNIGKLQPLMETVEETLRLLSNDSWHINLIQQSGQLEKPLRISKKPGRVLLFSGGLDSLAAAIEFSNGSPLAVVSHITKSQSTRAAQADLLALLAKRGITLPQYQYFVSSKNKGAFVHDAEGSQRTRSFVFLVIAALTARRLGRRQILMIAENGQMAIHLPLSSARMAAFSTHTAHPEVLDRMKSFLSAALDDEYDLQNPYVLKTKAEVIDPIVKTAPETLAVAVSCWKASRNATHCGECIPCFIRRVAIETHCPDPTDYARDIFTENFADLAPTDEGRRNLADLGEFTIKFETLTQQDIFTEWPELFSPLINSVQVIGMYKRAATQTRAIFSKYSGATQVLQ
jgi:7-cyano-7-deazaguanine synthase in queuosine biosynthesis